jgi:hypothetical protein
VQQRGFVQFHNTVKATNLGYENGPPKGLKLNPFILNRFGEPFSVGLGQERTEVRDQQGHLHHRVDGELADRGLVLLPEDPREADGDREQVAHAEEPGEGRRPRGVGGVGQRAADVVGGVHVEHQDHLAARVDGLAGQLAGEDAGQQREACSDEAEGGEEKNDGHGILPERGFVSDGRHDYVLTL